MYSSKQLLARLKYCKMSGCRQYSSKASSMSEKKLVLSNGIQIPGIAFGTGSTFMGRSDEVKGAVLQAWDAGFRYFDSAKMYNNEQFLGQALNELLSRGNVAREDVFLTSKILPHIHKYEDVVSSVEETLASMQVSYLDLVLPHGPGPFYQGDFSKKQTTEEEFRSLPRSPEEILEGRITVWMALQDLKSKGKIKSLGTCNFTKGHLESLAKDERCTVKPVLNQIELHPYLYDGEIVSYCQSNNIVVQAFSPIGRGVTGGGKDGVKIVLEDPIVKELAQKHSCTRAQVCLAWILDKDIALVTKTENTVRMRENFEASRISLSREDAARMDALADTKQRLSLLDPYTVP